MLPESSFDRCCNGVSFHSGTTNDFCVHWFFFPISITLCVYFHLVCKRSEVGAHWNVHFFNIKATLELNGLFEFVLILDRLFLYTVDCTQKCLKYPIVDWRKEFTLMLWCIRFRFSGQKHREYDAIFQRHWCTILMMLSVDKVLLLMTSNQSSIIKPFFTLYFFDLDTFHKK